MKNIGANKKIYKIKLLKPVNLTESSIKIKSTKL